jgi:hypothetical protein
MIVLRLPWPVRSVLDLSLISKFLTLLKFLRMKIINRSIIAFLLIAFLSGCSDFFNPDTDSTLLEENYIGSYTELTSGYMGIATAVQEVADKSIFLEGLRGDFLEPTSNAPKDFWDVYNYNTITNGNTIADPKGYYKVILNANDYIAHAIEYHEKNPNAISTEKYNAFISGAIRFKVWAYLMIAKIYGEGVYFEDEVVQKQDLSKYPLLEFDALINKCVELMETGINGIDGKNVVKWSEILAASPSSAEITWDRICPPPEALMAELSLWQGNYQKAFDNCINLIYLGGLDNYCYQINLSEYNGSWKTLFYQFYRKEHVAAALYDYKLNQTNNVIRYFSNTYPNLYYMRPTTVAMNRFKTQLKTGGTLGDTYRGEGVTYALANNGYVVQKFLAGNTTSDKIYRNDVLIPLYRASDIHLFLSEALGGLGRFEEALAFLNLGIESYYNGTTGQFNPPFTGYPSTLYYPSGDKGNAGVRGRVALGAVGSVIDTSTTMTTEQKRQMLDSLLIEESCVELAGESRSYYAMVRMAKRWGTKFQNDWAAKVAAKYPDGGALIQVKLEADIKNWFIKYDLGN